MKISVITVCFNSAETIGDTLDSAAAQTHPDMEHIVVDGVSKDDTLRVVEQRGAHVARVISEPDKGIYDAMNKGIAAATGDVVGFLNADDFFASPDALAQVAAGFEASGAESVHGDLCYVRQDQTSQIVRYWRSKPHRPRLFEGGWVPPHPAFYVRKAVYDRLGGFDLDFRIAADFELMARFLEVERISNHHIPEVLVHMRLGGATNRSLENIVEQNKEIRRAFAKLGIPFSWPRFLARKAASRGRQFVVRPRA